MIVLIFIRCYFINFNINYLFYSLTFLLNQTKEFFIPPLFYPSNQTHRRETKISSILPLFHPPNQMDP